MTNKEKYLKYLSSNTQSVMRFNTAAWFNLLAKEWDVLYCNQNEIEYFLPYSIEKKGLFTFVRNLHFTPFIKILAFSKDGLLPDQIAPSTVLINLLSQLQNYQLVELDVLAAADFVQVAGISTLARHTNVVDLQKSTSELYSRIKSSCQRQIKKAELAGYHLQPLERGAFIAFLEQSFLQKQMPYPYNSMYLQTMADTLVNTLDYDIIAISHQNGEILAAAFILYDADTAYNLLCASNYKFRNSGAMNALMWHCMQMAKQKGFNFFDFEGSSIAGVDRFYRSFGGSIKSYVRFIKTDKLAQLALKIKKALL